MKYWQDPNDPDELLVDASPIEVHSLRGVIIGYLARWGAPSREHEDLAQWVEVITWQGLSEGRVRGSTDRSPRAALLCFMVAVAWNLWQNYRRRYATQNELFVFDDESIDADALNWMGQIEARDLLLRISRHSVIAEALLSAALEISPIQKRSAEAGLLPGTYSEHLGRARRWIREVHRTGKWREPPTLSSPKNRKRRQ